MFLYMLKPGGRISLKFMESMLGFWEFCLECLPPCLKSFAYNAHVWMAKLKRLNHSKKLLRFVPRKIKKDTSLMLQATPMCNGTQPLQPHRGKEWCRPLMTDASGSAGGYCTPFKAFHRKFACREQKQITALKEAQMVLEAVSHNGDDWNNMVSPTYIDNTTAMYALNGRSGNQKLNQLVRSTLLTMAQHDVTPV